MDRCLHGVFLDSGELRKIKEFIIAGGEHGVASVKTAPKDHSSSQHRIRMNADLTHSTTGEVIAVLISEALSAMDVL